MIETMIDIETLDTGPRAVVLSAAVVKFTQEENAYAPFTHVTFDIDAQLAMGRTISQDTLLWWMRQDQVVRDLEFNADRRPLTECLGAVTRAVREGDQHWANSPSFDMTILGSLFEECDWLVPWSYRDCRDVRTLKDLAQIEDDWNPSEDIPGVAHDPVYDCRWQIELVREARRRLFSS